MLQPLPKTYYQLVVRNVKDGWEAFSIATKHYSFVRAAQYVKRYQDEGFNVCLCKMENGSLIETIEFKAL